MCNAYIYAFCGDNEEIGPLNTIERIKAKNDAKWEYVEWKKPPSPRFSVQGLMINENTALIFGGVNGEEQLNSSYTLSIAEDRVECCKCYRLADASSFKNISTPMLVNGSVFCADSIGRFHVKNGYKDWEIISI